MTGAVIRAILIGCVLLHAAVGAGDERAVFSSRRDALMKRIGDSAAVLQGAPETRSYTAFRQDNNFYYLTGVEAPNALLLIDGARRRSILFLEPRDREAERWEGRSLFAGPEALRDTGIDEVQEASRFGEALDRLKGSLRVLYTPLTPEETAATSRDRALRHDTARRNDPWDGRISRRDAFEKSLRARLGDAVEIRDLSPVLDDMRRVKNAHEIELLREAGRISALGVKEAMRSAAPGIYEYQLAALAEFRSRWVGAQGPAFFPIVGSGPNSCILHYTRNRRKLEEGDIVVMDFGVDYGYYQSDITRTFPASGRFSGEQARVYRAVLDAQKAALSLVRPGAVFEGLRRAAEEALGRWGYAKYMAHSVGHYVGMSVHDVGESKPFEPGVVLAVEPGVYLPERNLGVRIEDTVLVTGDGCEILTKDAPKEIEDIERLMAERGVADAVAAR
jgi:Xaa-Pro aminopeptidase